MPLDFALISHRGASDRVPENTLEAFDLALTFGPSFETDVQLTEDKVCVILHDEKLGRTVGGTGLVNNIKFSELSSLDAGSWFSEEHSGCRVPSLQSILRRYRGKAHIHLELKSQQNDLAEAVKSDLEISGWMEDLSESATSSKAPSKQLTGIPGLTITSFHLEQLKRSIKVTHGWLIQEIDDEILQAALSAGVRQICPRVNACSKEQVDKVMKLGFDSVRGWGIKDHELLRKAVACGMHGATVNWPDEAIEVLRGLPMMT